MCKQQGRTYCSELGNNHSLWNKDTPLPKPKWVEQEFQIFSESLKLAQESKTVEAKSLLKNSRDFEMREWFDVHAQNSGGWRNKSLQVPAPDPIFHWIMLRPLQNLNQCYLLEITFAVAIAHLVFSQRKNSKSSMHFWGRMPFL